MCHVLPGGQGKPERPLMHGEKVGVHNVHTRGFGFGCTGIGLGRIREVFGGVAYFQGMAPGSSPTSGTCFPCSGAFKPLSVHKLCCEGPLRGLFHWWLVVWPVASFLSWIGGLLFPYLFMDVRGPINMTSGKSGGGFFVAPWMFTWVPFCSARGGSSSCSWSVPGRAA